MRRAGIALCVVIALVAVLGSPASAGERRLTRSVHYTGWNEWHFLVGGASGSSGPAVFTAPSWARSVRVLVRDDTELRVAYKVRFNRPRGANTGPAHGCGGRTKGFELRSGTKRLFVQTEAPAWGCGPGTAVPTTGVITVTFSSRSTIRDHGREPS